jgi:hypothetical protein
MSVHKSIHVIADDGTLDVDTQHLNKGRLEQARWLSDTGNRSIIYFNKPEGSPFQETEFHVPAGGDVSSGPIRAGLKNGDTFRYTVVGQSGTNDPVIIIDN